MNVAISDLSPSILQKPSLTESTPVELELLIKRFPFFVPGRLLYLKKLQEDQSPAFQQELMNAELWMPNTPWLDHLFFGTGEAENPVVNTLTTPAPVQQQPAGNVTEDIRTVDQSVQEASENIVHSDVPTAISPEQTSNDDEPAAITIDEVPEAAERLPITTEEKITQEDDLALETARFDEIKEAGSEDDSNASIAESFFEDPRLEPVEEPAAVSEEEDEYDTEQEEELPANGQPELRMPVFKQEPITEADLALNFELFHTVDYFASQGIQAKEEDKPVDRFSQQLKSFTQWLKTMKKIPAPGTAGETGLPEEKKIEQMAEHSIKGRDIWTEAMAEVWLKQGNHGRAVEVYQKLSLLDPSKSAYFAAKIELLKK